MKHSSPQRDKYKDNGLRAYLHRKRRETRRKKMTRGEVLWNSVQALYFRKRRPPLNSWWREEGDGGLESLFCRRFWGRGGVGVVRKKKIEGKGILQSSRGREEENKDSPMGPIKPTKQWKFSKTDQVYKNVICFKSKSHFACALVFVKLGTSCNKRNLHLSNLANPFTIFQL